MKTLLAILLLIPSLSWGEYLECKKIKSHAYMLKKERINNDT